jgi:hypothetical protein
MKLVQRKVQLNKLLWAFFICTLTYQARAEAGSSYWLCRKSMEVRTLRIQATDLICVAWYTKDGLDEKVADSKDSTLCGHIVSKIRATLESAGWRCKDISSSQISGSRNY